MKTHAILQFPVLLLLLFLASCRDRIDRPNEQSVANPFWPIALGDVWLLHPIHRFGESGRLEVVDSVQIGEKWYWEIRDEFGPDDAFMFQRTYYVRNDNNGNILMRSSRKARDSDYCLVKNGAAQGDAWNLCLDNPEGYRDVKIALVAADSTVAVGKLGDKVCNAYSIATPSSYFTLFLAKGVGPILTIGEGKGYLLEQSRSVPIK